MMKVTNHGVPEALWRAMMDACKKLLTLPPEQKQVHMDVGPMDPVRHDRGERRRSAGKGGDRPDGATLEWAA